ncbi:hypothetical protein [Pontixanthobacter gangjinensis]|uniref:Uncharacterized protein n=1 Tax=Pontixanthobacter gangjinensis TaxID=1028742 RepID=A0A6I4SR26_9SPHN|nr:hypothetical protein [Pontixanthobacter gangjinensis]MXO57858.1 hypothetical protein [Pontixanthobacter gangjinensis]
MTIPPSRHKITYWYIAVRFQGIEPFFEDEYICVSAKGYLATRATALFKSKAHAQKFLDRNIEDITRRCGSDPDFDRFEIKSGYQYWPIEYDEPISLLRVGKRGKSRSSLYRNGVR